MLRSPLILGIVALLLLAGPAIAPGCTTTPTTTMPAVPPVSTTQAIAIPAGAAGTYYLTNACDSGVCAAAWLYKETNTFGGLQRSDSGHDDTNGGACYAPDQRVL